MNNNQRSLHLLTETTFHTSYLISMWRNWCTKSGRCCSIAIRKNQPDTATLARRQSLHQRLSGKRHLEQCEHNELLDTYPGLTASEESMISEFGIPAGCAAGEDICWLGDDINATPAKKWLAGLQARRARPYILLFLDQIFDQEWIDATDRQLINAHSALLPWARGNNSIEQVVALGEPQWLYRAAGGTVHYIDAGVDTGPIICTRPLAEPLAFDSVWTLKSHCFMTAFSLLIEIADRLVAGETPAARSPDPSEFGPNYRAGDFDKACQQRAERQFLRMRANLQG